MAYRFHVLITFFAVLAVIGLGWLDYITGPHLGFSLFYIVPIAFCAWRVGRASSYAVAGVASIAWLAADIVNYSDHGSIGVSLWNGFTRLVIYYFVATSVGIMRSDRVLLAENNRRLRAALDTAENMARVDGLTGLLNARAFRERLKEELPRARRSGAPLCLAYIDLDNFKLVNDRYGHAAGDDALRLVAEALQDAVREGDLSARLGGDEFAVVLWDLDSDGGERAARRIVEKVTAAGTRWQDTRLGASVGLAFLSSAPETVDDALRAADAAMYEAKRAGKGTVVVTQVGGPDKA